ncbi:MAG: urea ABC transporter permease subunit UrtB [Myxococcales bacterium]|nr:urea ABC transporter permease subunit UrtB [Myxococcales bacterium]
MLQLRQSMCITNPLRATPLVARLTAILGLLAIVFAGTSTAGAQSVPQLARRLTTKDTREVRTAIVALGKHKDPRALAVLEALEQRRLKAASNGQVFIAGPSGDLADVATGKVVETPPKTRRVSLTNATRRAVRKALAQLRLHSQDVEVRRAGARVVSQAPGADDAEYLRTTLEKETDSETKELLSLAVAQIDLKSDSAAQRLAAVRTIADVGELSLKPQLKAMLERDGAGRFSEPDPDVRAALTSAVSSLEGKELLVRVVRDIFYGMSLGSVLLLAALGLAITFGLMGVINMAHGEMIMLGAYSAYVVQDVFATAAPAALDWYLLAALPTAFIVCFLVGVLLERTVIRFLYGRPLETLLATWGISLIIIQVVRLTFGAQNVTVANPSWLSGGWELVSGVVLPYTRLATMAFVAAVVGFVWYLLRFTHLGLHVRAITQNRRMARCMGIPTERVDMMTFGLGSAVAGLGGVALSQIGNVGPELGQQYIVDSFMVVVVGGVGELAGTVVAALGLGTVNKILEPVSGAVLGKIMVLGFIILFIQRRPQGLFALKGRAAEG